MKDVIARRGLSTRAWIALLCPACSWQVGTARPVIADFAVDDGWIGFMNEGDDEPSWEPGTPSTRPTEIGLVVVLGPGFVNAKHSDPTGYPVYKRGRNIHSTERRIRPPAIVVCKCSEAALVTKAALVTEAREAANRHYATAKASDRFKELQDIAAEEAGDRYIHEQGDRGR